MRTSRSNPRRRLGLSAGAISVLLIGSLVAAGPAPAATPCTNPPVVIPVEQLTPGMLGSGMTALAGTTPVPFTFEIVGTIPDGYRLGLDAIVIHITGPQSFLDKTGGVFFGMSGSPAYVNGKLAGAVSAVFDDPTFGAVTPAEAMLEVLGSAEGSSAMRPAQTIVLTPAIRRAIARIQGVPPSAVTGTFEQLPLPLAVSGLSDAQIGQLQARLDDRGERFVVYAAGSAPASQGAVSTTPFVPGEPLGVAIAYGDASYYATGTATFTCGDYVTAFGHPFFYDAPGPISLGLSGAEGLMIVKPLGWPGYRFALLTEPRGTIVQDRFAGIAGIVGAPPTSVPVVSTLTNLDTGASRVGTTEVMHTWGWWLEEIVWSHLSANFAAVFGHLGGGSSSLDWTITGTLGDEPFTVSNHTMTSSEWDVSEVMWPLVSAIDTIQFNGWSDATFTDISTTGWLTEQRLEGTIGRVRVASSTQPKLRVRDTVLAHPGDVLTVEVKFDMLEGEDVVTTVELEVPQVRGTRDVLIRGGRARYQWPDSADELLEILNGGEHPDDLVLRGLGGGQQWPQGFVVSGKHRFEVQIVR